MLKEKEQINLCLYCKNRKRDFKIGIVCSFDNKKYEKPVCDKFIEDSFKKRDIIAKREQSKIQKLYIKISGGVGIFILLFIVFHLIYAKIRYKNEYIDESLVFAQIIQNEPLDTVVNKLTGKLFLEKLTIPGLHPHKVSAERENPALECLTDFFEIYKAPFGYISYKNYYFDKNDKINLVFLVASPDNIIDIYEIKTGRIKDKVKIIDFYSYSRGEWESKIQSQYMERLNIRELQKTLPVEQQFISIDSLIGDSAYIQAINLLQTLPDRFSQNGDVREGILELSKMVSLQLFEKKLDSMASASLPQKFIKIWKYRKAFLFNDKISLQELTEEIIKEVGEDPVLQANALLADQYSVEIEEVEKNFLSLISLHPKLDYIRYLLWEFYSEQFEFEKASKLEKELFSDLD